jgi:hypothetical protein
MEPEVMGTPPYFKQLCESVFSQLDKPLTIIEVGTWKGASAFRMIEACDKKCKMYCVDTWLGSTEHYDGIERDDNGYPCIFKDFWNNVKEAGYEDIITPITLPSIDAAHLLEKRGVMADVIYIDAAHDYTNVKADMEAYWKLLKNGGVFIGDDYHPEWYGVMGAVQQFSFQVGQPAQIVEKSWLMKKRI